MNKFRSKNLSYRDKSSKTAFHPLSPGVLGCSSPEEEKGGFGFPASSRGRGEVGINKRHLGALYVQSKKN